MFISRFRVAMAAFALLALAGCVEMPTGPSVAVMPSANKPFSVFMQDDDLCRGWAAHSIGQAGHDAAAQSLLASTVTGAAIGLIAGGAMGGDRGAGTGAAVGTAVGASVGASQSAAIGWNTQRQYDIAYQQCMYSKGNSVPGAQYGIYNYGGTPQTYAPPPPPPPVRR